MTYLRAAVVKVHHVWQNDTIENKRLWNSSGPRESDEREKQWLQRWVQFDQRRKLEQLTAQMRQIIISCVPKIPVQLTLLRIGLKTDRCCQYLY